MVFLVTFIATFIATLHSLKFSRFTVFHVWPAHILVQAVVHLACPGMTYMHFCPRCICHRSIFKSLVLLIVPFNTSICYIKVSYLLNHIFPLYSPAGSVAITTGALACVACVPGTAVTMINTPQALCQPCAPGTFAVSSNAQQVLFMLNLVHYASHEHRAAGFKLLLYKKRMIPSTCGNFRLIMVYSINSVTIVL